MTMVKSNPIRRLSPRELEVLELIGEGKQNKEIALTLGISEFTIKNYLTPLFIKFEVHNRTELVLEAIKHGIIVRRGLETIGLRCPGCGLVLVMDYQVKEVNSGEPCKD